MPHIEKNYEQLLVAFLSILNRIKSYSVVLVRNKLKWVKETKKVKKNISLLLSLTLFFLKKWIVIGSATDSDYENNLSLTLFGSGIRIRMASV